MCVVAFSCHSVHIYFVCRIFNFVSIFSREHSSITATRFQLNYIPFLGINHIFISPRILQQKIQAKKKQVRIFFSFDSYVLKKKKKQNDHQMVHPTKQNIDIQPLELLFSSFLFNIEFCTRFSWISKRDWHLLHFCWNNNFLHTEYTRMHDQLMNDDDDDDCEKFCIYFLFHCHNSLASKTKSNAHTQSHTKSHTFIQQRHTFVIFYCCYCCCC